MTTMANELQDVPWVVFSIDKTLFAIEAGKVLSMVRTPEVVDVPDKPPCARGVINLRGEVLPLIDLRSRFGLRSFTEDVDDFCALMHQREEDHVRWLQELENSVQEKRTFSLATDHHLCAFGKWYDSYVPTTYSVKALLKRFDAPHRAIHGIAEEVKKKEQSGDQAGAQRIIDACRENELAEMIKLFAEMREAYKSANREIVIVVAGGSKNFAFTVDSVFGVERLAEGGFNAVPEGIFEASEQGLILSTGKRTRTEELVQLVDHRKIMETVHS